MNSASDPFTVFAETFTLPRLSHEEEAQLALDIKNGNHGSQYSKNKLINHNLRLAVSIARKRHQNWVNIMDLVQEAMMGIVVAAEKWDPEENVPFGTYAAFWIKAHIGKFMMRNMQSISVANSRIGRKVYSNLPKIRRKLEACGRSVTHTNVAKELQEDEGEVLLVLNHLTHKEISLDPLTPTYDSQSSQEYTLGGNTPSIVEEILEKEQGAALDETIADFRTKLVKSQNKIMLTIWDSHLMSQEPIPLASIGKEFNLTRQRMSQMCIKLKNMFAEHLRETHYV